MKVNVIILWRLCYVLHRPLPLPIFLISAVWQPLPLPILVPQLNLTHLKLRNALANGGWITTYIYKISLYVLNIFYMNTADQSEGQRDYIFYMNTADQSEGQRDYIFHMNTADQSEGQRDYMHLTK